MKTLALNLSFLCSILLSCGTAFGQSPTIKDMDEVVSSVNSCLSDANADCVGDDIAKYVDLPITSEFKIQLEGTKSALKLALSSGKPNLIGLIEDRKYGNDINVKIYYINLPDPANQFLFVKYSFFRTVGGWKLTGVYFKASGVYPIQGF